MYVAGSTVPDRRPTSSAFISELSMPLALLRNDMYNCRTENDTKYFDRSSRLFNNPTKQDRYGADKWYANPESTHGRGDPMPHGGVNTVQPTRQAITSKANIPQPGGSLRTHIQNGPTRKDDTSFVGVATCGSVAPVW